ncbi:MAG TPA: hypothetical protein VKV40_07875 [Ktedonobacteraceae bacterium]|nr:hypothetical protein [Ktedonobacteraceae bacterium]
MTTYPILLKSQPDTVPHLLSVVEGDTEGDGFEYISTWLKLPWTKEATRMCLTCGAIVEMPDGSVAAHLKNYQAEHGGKDVIVRVVHHHRGPRPPTRPAGVSVATEADRTKIKTIKEYIQMQESSNQGS